MNRFLLLGLTAGLLSPISLMAGDLGKVDSTYTDGSTSTGRFKEIEDLSKKDVWEIPCELYLHKSRDCLIEFENGRLKEDGSKGITPAQVRFFNWPGISPYSGKDSNAIGELHLFYVDTNGEFNEAMIVIKGMRPFRGFQRRFIRWMTTGV